jgi:predicted transcriptional regulator
MDMQVLNRENDETREQYAERLANIFGADFVAKIVIIKKLPRGWDWRWKEKKDESKKAKLIRTMAGCKLIKCPKAGKCDNWSATGLLAPCKAEGFDE